MNRSMTCLRRREQAACAMKEAPVWERLNPSSRRRASVSWTSTFSLTWKGLHNATKPGSSAAIPAMLKPCGGSCSRCKRRQRRVEVVRIGQGVAFRVTPASRKQMRRMIVGLQMSKDST